MVCAGGVAGAGPGAGGNRQVSRSLWRCRNPQCPAPHGAVLGRVTAEGGLVLVPTVTVFRVYLDTHRAAIGCPRCGHRRMFRGVAVISPAFDEPSN
jgi:hypothetical protein